MKTYADFILQGQLPVPAELAKLVKHIDRLERFFGSLWFNYVKNKGRTSTAYHLEQYDDLREFNSILHWLSVKGWITVKTMPTRNWSEVWLNEEKLLKFVSKEELDAMRIRVKFHKYALKAEYTDSATKTKLNGVIKDTGLTREGFAKAGNSEFRYDIDTLLKYEDIIRLNVHKAMDKLDLDTEAFEDKADYKSICDKALDHYIFNKNKLYTTGENINDSRGRAISQSLKKIFNPISNKDARSLLKVRDAERLTDEGLEAVYLFIAELAGVKAKSFTQKSIKGKFCYIRRTMPVHQEKCYEDYSKCKNEVDREAERDRAEAERKDFHENIWLERIYEALDKHFADEDYKWDIPIELDGTASMLQIQGVLLGHETFLHKTNVINPDDLQDAWHCDGIKRIGFKKVATPTLYGSSATPQALWNNAKYAYTVEELVLMNRELKTGYLAVAQALKEFIIKNVKPKLKMKVKIWGETLEIECNRYRNVGDYAQQYDIYDTKTGNILSIFHTITHKEPDLDQFKRFFVTLLIHHLDSRVADYVCMGVNWIIPIHDAFIVHPNSAPTVRRRYCYMLDGMYKDRNKILSEFFYSIGIDSKCATQWSKLMKKVKPVKGFKAQPSALK